MQGHSAAGELICPIRCIQEDCKSTFTKLCSFFRHLMVYHYASKVSSDQGCHKPFNDLDQNEDSPTHDGSVAGTEDSVTMDKHDFLSDVKSEGVAMVASLRANSSIPYSMLPQIVTSVNCITKSVASHIADEAYT